MFLFFIILISLRDTIETIAASNHGIFIPNSDSSKGTWLENNRSLEYYLLKNGVCFFFIIPFCIDILERTIVALIFVFYSKKDTIEYCNKFRKLTIKILDGQTRVMMVDDSQIVAQLMIYICSQMGIANYEEYSLIHDLPDSEREKTMTLRKQDKTLTRDHKKMEELKKKLHTDDDSKYLFKAVKSFSLELSQALSFTNS